MHLLNVEFFLSLQDLDEIGEFRRSEGIPLDSRVCVITKDKLAVAMGDTCIQGYL